MAGRLTVEAIGPADTDAYRETRLQALQDAPGAFSSTYALESQFSGADWAERANNFCTPNSVGFLARKGETLCGLAGCFIEQPLQAVLVSMWVSPQFRRAGVGQKLIGEVSRWAASRGVKWLNLMVTENNQAAIAFYERLGFLMTSESEPYGNDPSLREFKMTRLLPS